MRTLFLRIFIWFWLATALIVALLVISSPMFTRSRPRLEDWERNAEEMLRDRMAWAARELQDADPEQLEPPRGVSGSNASVRPGHRVHPGPGRHTHLFIFDEQGREVLGQPPHPEAQRLALQAFESGGQEQERRGSEYLLAQPAVDRQGRQLVLVAALRRPPRLIDLLEPRVLAPRLLLLVLVVGALSLLLARHLTSPLSALRQATRRLTSGDLAARVGDPIRRRGDEVGELARDFNAMAERVQGLIGAQQRLLRDVSHELRSPLARQAVALGLARQQVTPEVQQWLDRIECEGQRLDALIEQLLTLTRLESGAVNEELQPLDLAQLVRGIVSDAQLEAEASGRGVRLVAEETLRVEGRPEMLRSAIENVVRNAVRFTAEQTTVDVSLEAGIDGSGARVLIRDHGPGVSDEVLAGGELFAPFFRVEDARDRQAGGTGLGLTIAARAVALHGGAITAENADGGGLLVTIVLPV